MPSAVEECREPSGKCQGIVREFQIVWRVVTLCGTSCSCRSVNWVGLASGYASQHILSQSLSLEINSVAADRASGIKNTFGCMVAITHALICIVSCLCLPEASSNPELCKCKGSLGSCTWVLCVLAVPPMFSLDHNGRPTREGWEYL